MPINSFKKKHLAVCISAALLTFSSGVRANATGEQVVAGQAGFERVGSNLIITQGSQRTIINWEDFSNNVGELTKFIQPNSSAAALNRVISGNPSALLGDLEANGHIYLINPNGIVVGADANINTQSFIASTLDVADADFMNGGDLNFVGDSQKTIENLGTINGGNGDVFLIAKHVENNGTIKANNHVGLAGANDVVLKASGDDRLAVRVTDKDGRVDQKGLVEATKIELRTAGNNPYALAINHEGVTRATSAVNKQGRIILFAEGGTTKADGTLDASAPETGDGGFIETSGRHVKIADTVNIDTSAANGETGTWLIDPNDFTIAATGGDMTAATLATQLASNNVEIQTATQGTAGGNGDIFVNDAVSWSTNTNLTLTAERHIDVNATINGGGNISLQAGNGANGINGTAPGNSGSAGIAGGNVTIDAAITSTQGNIIARAGNGGNGGHGAAGTTDYQRGGFGGSGGFGGDVTSNAILTANQGSVTLTAGHSGSGGRGGNGSTVVDKANVGGGGGHAGVAGDVQVNAAIIAENEVTITAGFAGSGGAAGTTSSASDSGAFAGIDGGAGGQGGAVSITDTITTNSGDVTIRAGHGGNGNRGSHATDVHRQKVLSTSMGNILSSVHAMEGGDGGDGLNGGSVTQTAAINSGGNITITAGNSGSGGDGGNGGDGGIAISSTVASGLGDDGGFGGDSSTAGSINSSASIQAAGDIVITAGHAGSGGLGGLGGFGAGGGSQSGNGGDGGHGGHGGIGGSVTLNNTVSTSNGALTIRSGNGGSGGNGVTGGFGGNGRHAGRGGNGGFGGSANNAGNVVINADISFTETGMITAGHGGHGGNGGNASRGGTGGSGASNIDAFGGNGGHGGNGGNGSDGGKVDINANITGVNGTLTVSSGNAGFGGVGRAGGAGGALGSSFVGPGSLPGNPGNAGSNGSTGNAGDIEVGGTINNTNGDTVLQSARDLVLQNSAAMNALGSGNFIGRAARNFHNDSGSNMPINVNTGRWLVYSSRPDQNRNDLEMNNDFVRYGTNYNAGDPNPGSFPTGNGLIYSASLSGDVTANDQTITYGQTISMTDFTFSNLLLDGGATTAAATGLDNNTSIEVEVDGVDTSTSDFTIAGNHVDGLNVNNNSGIALNITKGDLTVNQKTLTATSTADNKVYDANTTATTTFSDDRVAGDVLDINGTSNFDTKDAGDNKTVTSTGLNLSGTDAANYVLASTTVTDQADITKAALNVIANDATKEFDTSAFNGGNGVSYAGFVGGEDETELGGTLDFSGDSQGAVNLGTYVITPEGLTANNYAINFVDGQLTINASIDNNDPNSPAKPFGDLQSQNNPPPPNPGQNNSPPPIFSFGGNSGGNSQFPLREGFGNGAPPSMSDSSSFDSGNEDE